ncbi:MAG: response regulator transcription factor [Candidatus Latescibacterota bacterium]
MSIRIMLVDDHQIVREGLRALIDSQPDMKVVAEAEDGRTAVQMIRQQAPEVVVMDVGMPQLNGVEATRQIVEQNPSVRVIALSMHNDRRFVTGMLKAGAAGYLLKNSASDELLQAIHTVTLNQTYLSPAITGIVVEDYVRQAESIETSTLTNREREVLQLLAEGKSTKQIAAYLHVSTKTVATHRQNIMDKLELHSIAELTQYAISSGLITLEE